jgi:NAD(P)H-dependent FMN reductase
MKLLLFSTSSRLGSFNVKVIKNIVFLLPSDIEKNVIDLRDYAMSIYDGDIEAESGIPANAKKLYKLFQETDGIIVSTAEYNGSIPSLAKNSIDWVSRIDLKCLKNKPTLIVGSSISPLGGIHGTIALKSFFAYLGAILAPNRINIGQANDAFDEKDNLKSITTINMIKESLVIFVDIVKKMK